MKTAENIQYENEIRNSDFITDDIGVYASPDRKEDIAKAKAALEFCKNKHRAIEVRFCLGGNEFYSYWINNNNVIKRAIKEDIRSLKNKPSQNQKKK